MRKIRRIFETTQEISFILPEKEFSLYLKSFSASERSVDLPEGKDLLIEVTLGSESKD